MADDTNTAEREAATDGKWYMVNKDGMATLCLDEEDAIACAAEAFVVWPHMGPYRAVQLVEVGRASLAASAGSEPVACNRFAWGRLYDKASILMAVIGQDGEVSSRADEVALLMHALHDVDGGEHMPGLMPAAKLITLEPPVVETSPGSPNFEGGAAYEAYMAANTHPSPPEGMAGWKLVPIEPTLDMGWAYLDAARESEPLRTHSFNHAGYRAMIAAAPPLPASEEKGASQ